MTLPKDFMYLWCLVKDKTRTILLLHLAVFLAGWTGVFGRLITLSGLPLVWYRIMISIVTMAAVMAISGRFAEQTGEDSATMLFYELVGGLAILSLCMPFYAGAHPGAITPGSRPYLCSLITTKDCMKYSHLSPEQRYTISVLLQRDEPMSPAEIARTIGVHRSTVSRELKRNSDGRGHHKYNHDLAQRKAERWSHTRHCTNGYGTRKGTDFSTLTDEFIREVEWKLNNRPRKALGYLTPLEYFKIMYNFTPDSAVALSN